MFVAVYEYRRWPGTRPLVVVDPLGGSRSDRFGRALCFGGVTSFLALRRNLDFPITLDHRFHFFRKIAALCL